MMSKLKSYIYSREMIFDINRRKYIKHIIINILHESSPNNNKMICYLYFFSTDKTYLYKFNLNQNL